MTTTQTERLMALADRYAFHIPGSQNSDEARAALLAALQEQAREGEAVAWLHGCNVLCADIDLWIDRCPHCGKPRPAAPAPQPAREGEAVPDNQILWLWKNGDSYLAFSNLFPCFTQGGDPMTLGEPSLSAVFRKSYDRHAAPQPAQQSEPAQPEQGPST